jgi:CubicO group peptidase (beta-lactamase class C family)
MSRRRISYLPPELIDLIARQKALNYSPGSEYLYSNTNYFLLAEVIKRATHKSLPVFTEENIFRHWVCRILVFMITGMS